MTFLFGPEGIFTNLLIVIVHLLLLLLVPLGILFAVTWSLLQIDNINQDIYARDFVVFDLFYASSYAHWLDNLDGKTVFYVMAGL